MQLKAQLYWAWVSFSFIASFYVLHALTIFSLVHRDLVIDLLESYKLWEFWEDTFWCDCFSFIFLYIFRFYFCLSSCFLRMYLLFLYFFRSFDTLIVLFFTSLYNFKPFGSKKSVVENESDF